LGEDDIVTKTCVENEMEVVGAVVGGSSNDIVRHTWVSRENYNVNHECAPINKNNMYTMFEFARGTEGTQHVDAAWLSGAIRGRFPGVHTLVIRNAEGAVSS